MANKKKLTLRAESYEVFPPRYPLDTASRSTAFSPSTSTSTSRRILFNELPPQHLPPQHVVTHPSMLARNPPRKGLAFTLVFFSLCVSSFLSAMDLTAVSTALPTIMQDLGGVGLGVFAWVGSAFALSGTAILPWTGGLAQIFGRKVVLIISLVLFATGSMICAAARSIPVLIIGRTIQGIGDGGIISLAEIIVADLVPLKERGTWEGVLGVVWAIASVTGPPLGGVLTEYASWRWVFYINIPVAVVAIGLVARFMKMKSPRTSFKEKMRQMDWWGNLLVIGATTTITIAITWGGVRFAWSSATILVPLILGFFVLGFFFWFEFNCVLHPTIPRELLSNRTSYLTYIAVLLHGVIAMAVIYVLPIYFQASLLASASASGVKSLPLALTIAPSAMVAAVSIELAGTYRPQNWVGWALTLLGIGLFTLLKADSHAALWMGVQIPVGAGLGCIFTAPQFPILASLHPRWAAQALALFTFVSSLGQTFGIVIGDSILQTELLHRLPQEFTSTLPHGVSSAVTAVSQIASLPEPLRSQVRVAFADGCRVVWISMIPLAAVGLATSLGLKALPLHEETDSEYGIVEVEKTR